MSRNTDTCHDRRCSRFECVATDELQATASLFNLPTIHGGRRMRV
jgi:hypothetical protein